MNYRHAYHAGNFADVMKHVFLVRILCHLRRKEAPFRVIDTHAGLGLYDLAGEEADRTAEWRLGIGRLDEPLGGQAGDLVAPYRAAIDEIRARHGPHSYPGSPALIDALLRRGDRGVFVELHPEDVSVLSQRFHGGPTKVLHLDGWTALHALIPPKERRGLVLIDPPYETPGELDRLATECLKAAAKWPTGIFAAWYPVKDRQATDRVAARLDRDSPRPGLRLELLVDEPNDPTRLNGSGLFVINPPWTLAEEAEAILPALAQRLARGRYGAYRCEAFGSAPA